MSCAVGRSGRRHKALDRIGELGNGASPVEFDSRASPQERFDSLDVAPDLCLLATSREALQTAGEYVFRLQPLDCPPEKSRGVDEILSYPAARLFAERVSAQGVDLALGADDAILVAVDSPQAGEWFGLIRDHAKGRDVRAWPNAGRLDDIGYACVWLAPHGLLAPWRSRLTPLILARRAEHARAAQRIAGRLFAERPRAFRKRIEALWKSGKR